MPSYLATVPTTPNRPVSHVARARGKPSLTGVLLAVMAATLLWSCTGGGEAAAVTLNPGDILMVGGDSLGTHVIRVDPVTAAQTIVATNGFLGNGGNPALTLAADGQILVLSLALPGTLDGTAVIRIDPVTGAQTLVTTRGLLNYPCGIAVEADGQILVTGQIVVADTVVHGVIRVDPVTGTQTVVTTDDFQLCALAVVSKKSKTK